ncbi:carboxypeptidase M32 [Halarchaeum nitratireducens]|uniref:Metal-dependent carboxypeptidase n=1 Tax=Halarchaeum nitratireducens TaxID=489913 RepID=A0A830G6A4_9EURY|nr:carboxypeptidase M32 [Halarchaeum nitratireducens]GGN06184.1 carboxypeptidase M32 [Halarchaeum nitratireducens]
MTDHRADAPEAYRELLDQYERVTALGGVQGTLSWDQQVMMPEGGNPARSKQLSVASGLSHDLLTDDVVADSLAALDDAALADEQAAVVREIERQYVRAERVPRDLVEEISRTSSEALQAWEEARENDDFETFAPYLDELVDLKREYAAHIDDQRDSYAVLFEEYEPYLDLETAERVLDRLREELVPLIDAVQASDADLAAPFAGGTYDPEAQEAFSRDVLDALGYDWDRGRLDTSTHPFTVGNQFDSRITTRFSEDEPLDSMMSTVHEFGHARYNLGLPREEYGTPLGEARDLTVHESQSRLWENHVGRSAAFWEHFAGDLRGQFPTVDATPRDLYEAANRVYPDNLIRVEADELTYHMHIVLRFEIERALISGDLDVADVPEAWNDKMAEYLGVRPDTDSEGCLQDIHWSHGNFGYFPTYSLGSVLAAQLYAHAEADIDGLDAAISGGDFDPLADWLGERVHRHGRRYTTPDLIEEATGEPYTADHFLDYVNAKFGDLYDL